MLLVKLLVPRRHRLCVDHTHLGNCIFHEFFYPTNFWFFTLIFSRIFRSQSRSGSPQCLLSGDNTASAGKNAFQLESGALFSEKRCGRSSPRRDSTLLMTRPQVIWFLISEILIFIFLNSLIYIFFMFYEFLFMLLSFCPSTMSFQSEHIIVDKCLFLKFTTFSYNT